MKLLNKDLKKYREWKLKQQKGKCAMCGLVIKCTPCLDHDHKLKFCRGVACRACNILLGKLENAKVRTGMKDNYFTAFLKNIHKFYQQDYSNNPTHPKELSLAEKELKRLKKRIKGLKTEKSKLEYKQKMADLKKVINKERENCWREDDA